MAHGDFIWCDLSAYDPPRAMRFYAGVFGWRWSGADESGTYLASAGGAPVASLYQMPEKFMQMGMPSFWMSYIAVDDAEAVVEQAKLLGGKVELGPADYPGGGRYALIRDPLGAGFTVLQGEAGSVAGTTPGLRAGHGLFVSDIEAIQPFYEALFGWSFGTVEAGIAQVHLRGTVLFHCHEIPDPAVRGKEEYWAVLFAQATGLESITAAGGEIITEMSLPEGDAVLARDPSGAAFVILKAEHETTPSISPPKWGWIGLGLVLISVFSAHLWPWAIFLGVWVIQGLRVGETHLLTRIQKSQEPVLFWSIMAVFSALAIASLLYPFGAS
ncbi:VOC family protein [Roseovarius sp. 2305UL8-3]|uniref:VOC family protein n=1 Tax=Roseovarius conchicola TaxID=3121636 RepID=UPI00352748ED